MPQGYKTISGASVSYLLGKYGERAETAMQVEMYQEVQGILAQSQPLVPVDTGALRGSGFAEAVKEGDVIRATVGYGGPAAQINEKSGRPASEYALVVHEDLLVHHPVGEAKYLEIPFLQAKGAMLSRIVAGMRSRLRGAGALGAAGTMSTTAEET